MSINIDMAWVIAVWLVSIRMGAALLMTPILGAFKIPARLRVLIIVMMSVVMVSAFWSRSPLPMLSEAQLITSSLSELALGATFGFGVLSAFAAFQFGGQLVEMQMGLNISSIFDPVTRAQMPILGMALNLLAVTLFFAMNLHHVLFLEFSHSLEIFPPGSSWQEPKLAAFAAQFGNMFLYGLLLVAPVSAVLFVTDFLLALVSRSMPQINMFIFSVPIKVVIGLITLMATVPYMGETAERVFGTIYSFWHKVI